jgi:hypothetical protein
LRRVHFLPTLHLFLCRVCPLAALAPTQELELGRPNSVEVGEIMRTVIISQQRTRLGFEVTYFLNGRKFDFQTYAHMSDVLRAVKIWLTY